MQIKITITGDKEIGQKLAKLGDSLMDFSTPLAEFGADSKKYYETEPFLSRGTIYGQEWPSLSPKYAVEKAKQYPGKPIMVRTGFLQSNFKLESSTNFMRIWNPTPYFNRHQTGNGVPKRLIMAINTNRLNLLKQLLQSSIRLKIDNVSL